jgi:hypothetical protein
MKIHENGFLKLLESTVDVRHVGAHLGGRLVHQVAQARKRRRKLLHQLSQKLLKISDSKLDDPNEAIFPETALKKGQ